MGELVGLVSAPGGTEVFWKFSTHYAREAALLLMVLARFVAGISAEGAAFVPVLA